MSWDLSCKDWESRLRSGRSLVPRLPLNKVEADRAVAVFNKLRLADVPGTPLLADAAGDWFRDVVRALFGSLNPKTKARAIRELFLLVPKKNAKTSYGALLMVVALLLNERPRATFIMTAPVQDVADLAFGQAAGAIALDGVLIKKLHVREHLKTIIHRETGSSLQILTFDPAVLTGQKPAGVLIDELHVVAKMSKASSAIRQLRGGLLPIPEAFMAFITTQSEEAPTGAFRAELMKARAIRDGRQEGVMLPVLFEFPTEMQKDASAWRNPENWWMVTPNAGRSVSISRLKEDFATAEASGEEELRAWASQHLNIEIGLALHHNRWPGADFWEQQGREEVTLEAILKRCEVIVVGIDGGGMDDMLGLNVLGRERGTSKWLSWSHAWLHPIALERRKSEAPRYRQLERDGDLTILDTLPGDVSQVAEVVARIHQSGLLARVGLDPEKTHKVMLQALLDAKIPEDLIIGISQGWKLCGAIAVAERKLAEGVLVHGAQPLMAWCVGNAKVEPKGNASLITKQASGFAKIDPLMAMFNSVSLMALNPPAAQKKFQFFTL
jgi:phage terminase large subunit-like protein